MSWPDQMTVKKKKHDDDRVTKLNGPYTQNNNIQNTCYQFLKNLLKNDSTDLSDHNHHRANSRQRDIM